MLSVQDPAGDTAGNGTLVLPTAALYESRGPFDVTAVTFLDAPTLSLELSLGSLANPLELPLGFSFPIIELYLSDETLGAEALLPGSGMRLPDGATWHYAFQLSGEALNVFAAENGTVVELSSVSDVRLKGNTIVLETSLPRPERFTLFGMVGQYTPFSATGWQPLSLTPSPWAFSSPSQGYPVIDVISARADLQERALQTGVLPGSRRATAPNAGLTLNAWTILMVLGLLTALVGLIGRLTLRPLTTRVPARQAYGLPRNEPGDKPLSVPEEAVPEDNETIRKNNASDMRSLPKDSLENHQNSTETVGKERIASGERAHPPALNEKGWLDIDTDALSAWETFNESDAREAPLQQSSEEKDKLREHEQNT